MYCLDSVLLACQTHLDRQLSKDKAILDQLMTINYNNVKRLPLHSSFRRNVVVPHSRYMCNTSAFLRTRPFDKINIGLIELNLYRRQSVDIPASLLVG